MTVPWWGIGSLIICAFLAFIFIVGSFFEMRRYLRNMKKDQHQQQQDITSIPD